MSAVRGVAAVACVVLVLSVSGASTWMYSDAFFSVSSFSSSWHWLEGEHHYAEFHFYRICTDQSIMLLEVLVSVPATRGVSPPPTQAVQVRLRPIGGRWTTRRVTLHLTRNRASDWIYEGQTLLSRRALQFGSNLEVRVDPVSWDQTVGVYPGSVRVLASAGGAVSTDALVSSVDVRAGTELGVGGPLTADGSGASAVHTGSLPASGDETAGELLYRLPLSTGQRLLLQVEFTGGGGALQLVSPGTETVAAVGGEGSLHISYRAHVAGTWTVRLIREEGGEVRYRLRMETSG